MTKRVEHERAVALRKEGWTYNEIADELGLSKGTLWPWLHDVELSEAAQNRIDARQRSNWDKFTGRTADMSDEDREHVRERQREGGRKTQRVYGDRLHRWDQDEWSRVGLVYRNDELPTKEWLEELTGRKFTKEVIGRQIIDFADHDYLIEHTIDHRSGVSQAISRLTNIEDERRKVLITKVDRLGPLRRSRCVGITLIDVGDDEAIRRL